MAGTVHGSVMSGLH